MKKHNNIWLLLLTLCSVFASCKKDNASGDQLPPATQTGANTFGCKINGTIYIPKGSSGTGTPNPHVQYDNDLNGQPYLFIQAKQFTNSQITGGVDLTIRNLTTTGFYDAPNNLKYSVGWSSVIANCGMTSLDSTVQVFGGGIINRLDIPNHIISGTFDFKAVRTGCDTVRITDGRFDIKF